MNVDCVLETLNQYKVSYLLIGGMNFLLRHKPVLTFDIDLWIEDTAENRRACELALAALDAEWGRTDDDWQPVAGRDAGWLDWQALFCLLTPHGPVDIFRTVAGLADFRLSQASALPERTAGGVDYMGLSDEDMLRCQYAIEEGLRKKDRIETLERKLRQENGKDGR